MLPSLTSPPTSRWLAQAVTQAMASQRFYDAHSHRLCCSTLLPLGVHAEPPPWHKVRACMPPDLRSIEHLRFSVFYSMFVSPRSKT